MFVAVPLFLFKMRQYMTVFIKLIILSITLLPPMLINLTSPSGKAWMTVLMALSCLAIYCLLMSGCVQLPRCGLVSHHLCRAGSVCPWLLAAQACMTYAS